MATRDEHQAIAVALWEARANRTVTNPPSQLVARFDLADGYAVGKRLHKRRLDGGEHRQLNCLLHVIALVQVRTSARAGRLYYQRKRSEGKTHLAAFRALKRQLATVIYHCLQACAPRLALPPHLQIAAEHRQRRSGSQPTKRRRPLSPPGSATSTKLDPSITSWSLAARPTFGLSVAITVRQLRLSPEDGPIG